MGIVYDHPALLYPGPQHQEDMSAMVLPGHPNPDSHGSEGKEEVGLSNRRNPNSPASHAKELSRTQ